MCLVAWYCFKNNLLCIVRWELWDNGKRIVCEQFCDLTLLTIEFSQNLILFVYLDKKNIYQWRMSEKEIIITKAAWMNWAAKGRGFFWFWSIKLDKGKHHFLGKTRTIHLLVVRPFVRASCQLMYRNLT